MTLAAVARESSSSSSKSAVLCIARCSAEFAGLDGMADGSLAVGRPRVIDSTPDGGDGASGSGVTTSSKRPRPGFWARFVVVGVVSLIHAFLFSSSSPAGQRSPSLYSSWGSTVLLADAASLGVSQTAFNPEEERSYAELHPSRTGPYICKAYIDHLATVTTQSPSLVAFTVFTEHLRVPNGRSEQSCVKAINRLQISRAENVGHKVWMRLLHSCVIGMPRRKELELVEGGALQTEKLALLDANDTIIQRIVKLNMPKLLSMLSSMGFYSPAHYFHSRDSKGNNLFHLATLGNSAPMVQQLGNILGAKSLLLLDGSYAKNDAGQTPKMICDQQPLYSAREAIKNLFMVYSTTVKLEDIQVPAKPPTYKLPSIRVYGRTPKSQQPSGNIQLPPGFLPGASAPASSAPASLSGVGSMSAVQPEMAGGSSMVPVAGSSSANGGAVQMVASQGAGGGSMMNASAADGMVNADGMNSNGMMMGSDAVGGMAAGSQMGGWTDSQVQMAAAAMNANAGDDPHHHDMMNMSGGDTLNDGGNGGGDQMFGDFQGEMPEEAGGSAVASVAHVRENGKVLKDHDHVSTGGTSRGVWAATAVIGSIAVIGIGGGLAYAVSQKKTAV